MNRPEHFESPSPLLEAMAALEGDTRLDSAVDVLRRVACLVDHGPPREILSGQWLGHALHPLLTDLPLGCWIGAGLLDLFGGRDARRAAQRLTGLGLLLVPPTAASGLSDWSTATGDDARRVGVVHGVLNGAVAGQYLQSWRSRRQGRHARGVAWAIAGGMLAWASGYLGGHLTLRLHVGSGEPAT